MSDDCFFLSPPQSSNKQACSPSRNKPDNPVPSRSATQTNRRAVPCSRRSFPLRDGRSGHDLGPGPSVFQFRQPVPADVSARSLDITEKLHFKVIVTYKLH